MSRWRFALGQAVAALLFHCRVLSLLKPFFNRFRLETRAGRPVAPFLKKCRARNLQILTYHRVNDDPDPLFPPSSTREFDRQMEYLASAFHVLSLEDAIVRLKASDLPEQALVVTFDDGYRDNYLKAFPILRKYGLPATIFLATGAIDTGRVLWHDSVFHAFRETRTPSLKAYPRPTSEYPLDVREKRLHALAEVVDFLRAVDDTERWAWIERLESALGVVPLRHDPALMLSWAEVAEMHRAGIAIGSHTVTHPIISRLSEERAKEEMRESKQAIERAIGAPTQVFAYPNGAVPDFTEASKAWLKEAGYVCAVTMIFGTNQPGEDLFALKRISPWSRGLSDFAARLNFYKLLD